MHLLLIIGPPAVGKMTVGREVARRTGYKLFHNHMSIEPVLDVFDWGTPSFTRVREELRLLVLEEALVSGLPGLIFTFVWAFDVEEDAAAVERLLAPARAAGARIDVVELYADQDTRLAREGTELRLAHKRYKRDVDWARAHLRELDAEHRLTSDGDLEHLAPYLRVDNSHLSPADAADEIVRRLGLPGPA